MSWKRIAQWTWVLGILGLWALRLDVYLLVSTPSQGDFATYLAAATALRLHPHANIYDIQVITPYSCGYLQVSHTPYVYPPLLALLLEPFTLLPCHQALLVWQGINLALWLGGIGLLLRYLPRHRALLLPLGLFFFPLWSSFFYGQINEFIVLGILAVLWCSEHRHPQWAGVVLGLLTAIKLYPVLLLLYYVARRQWRVGIAGGVTVLASGLLMVVVVGLAGMRTAIGAIVAFHTLTDHYALNIALYPLAPVFPPLLAALALLFLAAALRYQDGDQRLGYAWGICTMTLVLPLIWEHYFVWLLPVFVYILSCYPSRRMALLLAPIYLVIALPLVFTPLLTALTLVPLWTICAWAFLASSARARHDAETVGRALAPSLHRARAGHGWQDAHVL